MSVPYTMHAFCNVNTLLTNGLVLLAEEESDQDECLTALERKEFAAHLMGSSEDNVMLISDLLQNSANGARAGDTKGMKTTIVDWITLKGQSLNLHIPRNVKLGHGFNHERTGALLCPAGFDWSNTETRTKLVNRQIQVAGDQWPVFLYANYTYDAEDPWNGLLCSGLLVSAFKHIFTSPSSVDQEPKATRSGNAHIHGIIVELLDDPKEKDEVDQLLMWWNRQVFPLYAGLKCLPSKDSALARICQRRAEYNERAGGLAE
ncbi:hypothetical protein BDN67DRAFT_992828 [Paxillus ammoniavirescens]|nr:hypothetical protein BDN67DRAFT_992828 [Paxillus ammoniavirescens]